MVNYLLKKSYQLKDLKEIEFNDLWGDRGVFTTMWIFENPCLLYTSPSPRDATLSRMPSSA